jgi:hypothetical protein
VNGLPVRLLPLVHRALAADPADRFPSAEAFASALRAAQKQDPSASGDRIALPPITGPEPTSRAAFGWIAALLVLGAGGAIAWRLSHGPAQVDAPPAPSKPMASQPPPLHGIPPPATTAPTTPTTVLAASQAPATMPAHAAQSAPPPAPVEADLGPVEAAIRERPQEAWTAAERCLQDRPGDGRAMALRVASLYWMARYDDMLAALQSAQSAGLGGGQLGSYPVIHAMMDDQKQNHRIPQDLFERMRAFLPAPRGGQPQGQQGPPRR